MRSWFNSLPARATALLAALVAVLAIGSAAPAGAATTQTARDVLSAHAGGGTLGRTLFVSARHGSNHPGCGHYAGPCRAIQYAVNQAPPGSTIIVEPGVYHEGVLVPKTLVLIGHHAVIDARGFTNGIAIGYPLPKAPPTGPLPPARAFGSSVSGFTVEHANGEGILALLTGYVRITHTWVVNNDLGGPKSTVECAGQGQVPGDCGEGVHLLSTSYSLVAFNHIEGNQGGVLTTDEVGPAHNNVIDNNYIAGNGMDCGVTLPGHNPMAIAPNGTLMPSVAGVYRNTVEYNTIVGNKFGAGVLFAAPAPGTASYDNLVLANYIAGNGLAGVTIHAHDVGQSVNGNRIIGNVIGRNNLAGDSDAGVKPTVGVLVFTAKVHITGLVILHNLIEDNVIGVWVSQLVVASPRAILYHNGFAHVRTPVVVGR